MNAMLAGLPKGSIAEAADIGGTNQYSSFRQDDGTRVEDQLQLPHLEQLRVWFDRHRPQLLPGRSEKRRAGLLTPNEFKEVIAKVLCTRRYDDQLDKLFTKLDSSGDGYVDWNELCSYILLQLREADYLQVKRLAPFEHEPRIRHIVYNRQETTTKIISVDYPTKFVTVAREGALCVWDTRLHLEKHYAISCSNDDVHAPKRRVKEWITDMVYMPNCRKIVVASTGRDLRFFDITSSQYIEQYLLFALQHVPYCLYYWFDLKNSGYKSLLFYGDDSGAINILRFHSPVVQLFNAPLKKQTCLQKIYFQDLSQHNKWVSHVHLDDIHPRYTINKLLYLPESNCVMSSSASPRHSLITMDIERKKKTYILKIEKGVECFAYSRLLNIIVTGSLDHLVRVWNPYVTSKPISVFVGHSLSIVDVAIHEQLAQVYSYSRDAVLKVWDIKEQVCLQSVYLKFPMNLAGRLPDYGPFSLHLHTAQPSVLLIAASDYLALLKIGPIAPTVYLTPTTHGTQLCSALYNPYFKQVVTGADDSTIAIWDMETGVKNMVFTGAHNNEEITTMTIDASKRRLITGARDGTIKVWNVQTGQNLHKLDAVTDAEVTGLFHLPDRKLIVSVGWNRKIVQYDDSDAECTHVKADVFWRGGQLHTDDILTAAHCTLCNLLATASYDGDIYVWSLETHAIFKRLRVHRKRSAKKVRCRTPSEVLKILPSGNEDGQQNTDAWSKCRPISRPNSRPNSKNNSRPNSRHRISHRLSAGQTPPVDKLLFLQARVKTRRMEAAILVSSEAGTLFWWNIYIGKQLGSFYVPEEPDECVLTISTNRDNSVLVTGDTRGRVALWDIKTYCISTQTTQQFHNTRPRMLSSWQAHDSVVVSVEYVQHDTGQYVLTGSTDKTAKLFSISGECVGTFGQKNAWNLRRPETWTTANTSDVENEAVDVILDKRISDAGCEKIAKKDIVSVEELVIPTLERGDTLVPDKSPNEPDSIKRGSGMALVDSDEVTNKARHRKLRPTTYTYGTNRTSTGRTLGYKAEERLGQRSMDRQCRREQLAEVNLDTTRVGMLCCPYQRLVTRELNDIRLPVDMPVTSRMINRGYTSAGLTTDLVSHMDIKSLYTIDTPAVEQFHNANTRRKSTISAKRLPAINKSHTYTDGFGSSTHQRKKMLTFI